MSILGERIRELRKQKDITQAELGKFINAGKSTISQYESGVSSPDYETLKKIADLFTVSIDFLLGRTKFRQPLNRFDLLNALEEKSFEITAGDSSLTQEQRIAILRALDNPSATQSTKLPLVGNIRAGLPIMARDHWVGELDVPADIRAEFALRIEGESMIGAGIHEGDFALCRQADIANTGNIVVAMRNISESLGEATLKYYFREKGKDVLRAANPDFEDIMMNEEGYRVAGIMVAQLGKGTPGYSIYREYISTRDYNLKAWDEVIEAGVTGGIEPGFVKQFVENQISMASKLAKRKSP